MIKTVAIITLLSSTAYASSLQQLDLYQSTASYRISGRFAVAASSTTYNTFTTTIDGTNGINSSKQITVSSATVNGNTSITGAITGPTITAIALSTTTLSTSTNTLNTAITNEAIARAAGDSALAASTTTIAGNLSTETSNRISGDNALAVATTTLHTETVAISRIDLSTITTALSGKLNNTEAVPVNLLDFSTITTALNGKADISGQVFTGNISAPDIQATYGIVASTGTFSNVITSSGAHIYTNGSDNWLALEKPSSRTFNISYDSRTFNSAVNRKALKILSDTGVGMEGTWLDDYGFWHIGDMESHFPNLWVSASTGPAVRIYGDILVGDLVYFGATSEAGLEVLQVGKRETGAYESGTYFMTAQHLNSDYRGGAYIYLGPNNANQGNERGNIRLTAFSSSTVVGTENSIYFSHRTGIDTVGDMGYFGADGNLHLNGNVSLYGTNPQIISANTVDMIISNSQNSSIVADSNADGSGTLNFLIGTSTEIFVANNGVTNFTHAVGMSSTLNVTAGASVDSLTATASVSVIAANSGIELGSTTVANTPYIDFHSSGNTIDYDSRLVASGGNGTSGNGTLQAYGTFSFVKNPIYTIQQSTYTARYFAFQSNATAAGPCVSGSTLTLTSDGVQNIRVHVNAGVNLAAVNQECSLSLVVDGAAYSTGDAEYPYNSILRGQIDGTTTKTMINIDHLLHGLSIGTHSVCLSPVSSNVAVSCRYGVNQISLHLEAP